MSVRWSGRGRARLLEQVAKIAAEDPAAATRWLTKVEDHVLKTAGTLPKLGRILPELGREDVRETTLDRRYRIVYRLDGKHAVIVTIFDGHQSWARAKVDPDAP